MTLWRAHILSTFATFGFHKLFLTSHFASCPTTSSHSVERNYCSNTLKCTHNDGPKGISVRVLPWQLCLCCLCLMSLCLSCAWIHCFVFVCVCHVFLWFHLLSFLGHALLSLPLSCAHFINWAALCSLYIVLFFPLVLAGSSCARDSYWLAALYSSLALLFAVIVYPCYSFCSWFLIFVLFFSCLAYICNVFFSCSSVLFLVLYSCYCLDLILLV